ncbi:hypothetical protein EHS25_002712 [Saitozyma podzolica]|uniref:Uncharacterized protein n=1 Tax=Saitozyma podzolica TaxID=1890683 RepID=A0A427YD45_9TREE|nr:hypothetical protein EHS25_002712 [Saitozyma podzolica]
MAQQQTQQRMEQRAQEAEERRKRRAFARARRAEEAERSRVAWERHRAALLRSAQLHGALARELLNPVLPGQRGYMAYIRRLNRLETAINPDKPPPYPLRSPVPVADSKSSQATGLKVEAGTSGTVPSTEKARLMID